MRNPDVQDPLTASENEQLYLLLAAHHTVYPKWT